MYHFERQFSRWNVSLTLGFLGFLPLIKSKIALACVVLHQSCSALGSFDDCENSGKREGGNRIVAFYGWLVT